MLLDLRPMHNISPTKIMSSPLPKHSKNGHASGMDVEPTVLAEPDEENADSLVSSNDPDDMANEQTWPTEEEMRGAGNDYDEDAIPDADNGTTPKRVRKIPKGMSEYQAAWIVDDTDDEDGDQEKDGEDGTMEEEEEMVEMPHEDDTEMETDGKRTVAFEDLDDEEEEQQ